MNLQSKLSKLIDIEKESLTLKTNVLITILNFLAKFNNLAPHYFEVIEIFPIYDDCIQIELIVKNVYFEIEIFENVQNIYIENITNDKSDDFDLSVSGDNLAYVVFSLIKMYELLID